MTPLTIRPAADHDQDRLWQMIEPVFREGETYAIDRDISRAAALDYWLGGGHRVWVAEACGEAWGTFYLCRNQGGGGAHVANAGFVTAPAARGRGVARAMLGQALDQARQTGFRAMQFNFVVSTNAPALHLWHRGGFDTVGRLPGAFDHPRFGLVDALVLFRQIQD